MSSISGYGGYNPYANYSPAEYAQEKQQLIDQLSHTIEHEGSEAEKNQKELRAREEEERNQ